MTLERYERPACPLCGSGNRTVLHTGMRDVLHDGPGEFTVVRCMHCTCAYLHPRPRASCLADYYPDHYVAFTDSEWSPLRRCVVTAVSWPYRVRYGRASLTLKPFGGRRLLDVGCGIGVYLAEMRRLGWDVYGVDLSPHAVQQARERIGTTHVWAGTLESLDPSIDSFDLVTLNHCLEHVPDPLVTLREAHRRLTPAGRLKVVVPDISGVEARLFGRHWLGLDVPRHLVDFSLPTLARALRQTGFRIERWRPQFMPWIFRASFDLATASRLSRHAAALNRLLYVPIITAASLSYTFGNRGAVDVVAVKDC